MHCGGTGSSNVSLRGLGSARTLVLVNGHRILNADLNAIPVIAVERIEDAGRIGGEHGEDAEHLALPPDRDADARAEMGCLGHGPR